MCGIAGYSGAFTREALLRANNMQSHRGPDAEGLWLDRNAGVGLAHRRLSIIDLTQTGAQPMHTEDGALTIIFNGEIYNFRELRQDLELAGCRFRGNSDTEVLLHLYQTHGRSMLGMLNGIFAFALWDKRHQSLLVARDAFGVKPLYYAQSSAGFSFASEIKALLCLAPELQELDIPALHRYLSFLWCPGENTPLQKIKKVLPGEALIVERGVITHRWAWHQAPIVDQASGRMTEREAVAGTTQHLRNAVVRQLVADVPVGAFLSGGLDSSAIVAFAREQIPDIHCFTIDLEGGAESGTINDLPYARRVARHLDVNLDVVTISAGTMAADIEYMVAQLDEPLADPAALNVLYISRLARQHGLKVLLSGTGGDDLFSGYRRHVAIHYDHYWDWLPRPLRAGMAGAASFLDQRRSSSRRLGKILGGAALSGNARLANYFAWAQESELRNLYTPAAREQLGESHAVDPMLEFLASVPSAAAPLDRMLALEQRFFLPDHNLNYTDKMSMAAGVEVRVPFLDADLVRYAAQVPAQLKQKGTVGKWVLKKAMEPYLPSDVIYRPKTGFGAPLRRWMRHELRDMMGDILSADSLKRRGLFDPRAVQNLIQRNENGSTDGAYVLFSLLCIEIWCRTYVDANRNPVFS